MTDPWRWTDLLQQETKHQEGTEKLLFKEHLWDQDKCPLNRA